MRLEYNLWVLAVCIKNSLSEPIERRWVERYQKEKKIDFLKKIYINSWVDEEVKACKKNG